MLKAFFFIALVAFASAQVDDWHTCADSIVKFQQDMVNFGASIEDKVKGTFIPDLQKIADACKHGQDDWATCATAVIKFGENLVAFGQEIEDTVKSIIIPDITAIKQNCHKAEDFEGINDWAACIDDINKIVQLSNKIVNDIKKFKFNDLVKDITSLYTLVQKALQDCTQGEMVLEQDEGDWMSCLADITQLFEEIKTIIADVKSLKIVKAIKEIKAAFATLKQASQDCKLGLEVDLPQKWDQCVKDIGEIVQLVPQIIEDAKKGNLQKLIKDVQALYELVQTAIKDCSDKKLNQDELEQDELSLPQDWTVCVSDVSKIIEFVPTIIDDIQKKNFIKLIADAQTLWGMLQTAYKDCFNKLEQDELSQDEFAMPGDWETCVEDIGKIVELAAKIGKDISGLDIKSLIQDVQDLYALVQKALKDCTQ